jgi:hypothetical protein
LRILFVACIEENVSARDFVSKSAPIPEERIFKSPDRLLNKIAPLSGEVAVLNEIVGVYRVRMNDAWAQSLEHIQ